MDEINTKQILQETRIKEMVHFESISSTNDWGKTFIHEHQQEIKQGHFSESFPFLVLANQQTAGRGRGNHSWFSPPGSLLFSILTTWSQLNLSRRDSSTLSLRTAKAVQKTIQDFLNHSDNEQLASSNPHKTLANSFLDRIRIKPPNDIYIDEKKIAGILIESPNEQTVIIGIGININNSVIDSVNRNNELNQVPNDLFLKIISLIDLTQIKIDRQSFLIALVNEII